MEGFLSYKGRDEDMRYIERQTRMEKLKNIEENIAGVLGIFNIGIVALLACSYFFHMKIGISPSFGLFIFLLWVLLAGFYFAIWLYHEYISKGKAHPYPPHY